MRRDLPPQGASVISVTLMLSPFKAYSCIKGCRKRLQGPGRSESP